MGKTIINHPPNHHRWYGYHSEMGGLLWFVLVFPLIMIYFFCYQLSNSELGHHLAELRWIRSIKQDSHPPGGATSASKRMVQRGVRVVVYNVLYHVNG